MDDIKIIKDLDTVRLLADPFKLKLIQAFAEADRTAADVAGLLDEPLTKLYRHVDALLDAGIIKVTRETPKRGTVERQFRTTARRFEVDQGLFAADRADQVVGPVQEILSDTEGEIVDALETMDAELEPVLVRMAMKGSPERLRELRESLLQWVESVSAETGELEGNDIEAGCLIAFYRRESD
ncbi:MAG: helix-turn-helix domain-containing protein [Pseudomonadota bacterium]